MHLHQLPLLRILAPHIARGHVLPKGDPFAHFGNLCKFPLTVFGEDGACFLETLVGHLFEGDIVGGEHGGAAAAGADRVEARAEELPLFARCEDGVWVEVWGWRFGCGCG